MGTPNDIKWQKPSANGGSYLDPSSTLEKDLLRNSKEMFTFKKDGTVRERM